MSVVASDWWGSKMIQIKLQQNAKTKQQYLMKHRKSTFTKKTYEVELMSTENMCGSTTVKAHSRKEAEKIALKTWSDDPTFDWNPIGDIDVEVIGVKLAQ